MYKYTFLAAIFLLIHFNLLSQKKDLTYYLPDISYNKDIPTPESVLGYQVGEWHVSHDQLIMYMRTIAEKSDRVTMTEYARTHENRPLIYLTITHPDNHKNLEKLKKEHRQLTNPNISDSIDIEKIPVVIYQGYSIHGNEPSGSNAALLNAYYLAAGQDPTVEAKLRNSIILLDPSFNPDGLHRFSSWVNMHKNKTLTSDPNDREYNEEWPRGRTNHYWFDLNRDWLLLTHPESQGRIRVFHEWKPEILTDHHEMGTNSTFFFQPGVPSRTNPNTPQKNQILTEEIGMFHAKGLDSIQSLYYTKASFDDFYYGKGSTYPDINGGVGILFEQASSRGHLQESVHGLLDFPFTIRNQMVTSLTTQEAGVHLKNELLEFKRKFYKDARREAQNFPDKAYLISDQDHTKLMRFVEILHSHHIKVHALEESVTVSNHQYEPENSFVVPTDQYQFKLIKTIFEKVTEFEDSIFYDVSSWTMPLAFNLQYDAVNANAIKRLKMDSEPVEIEYKKGKVYGSDDPYAFIFNWNDYFTPAALYKIQDAGLRTGVIHDRIIYELDGVVKTFDRGCIMIPVQNQELDGQGIQKLLEGLAASYHIDFYALSSGYGDNSMTLGHPNVDILEKPKAMMLVGGSVSSYDAGEIWHLLDTRYEIPLTKTDIRNVSPAALHRYNTIIMSSGSYRFTDNITQAISDWVKSGGTLLVIGSAINWASSNNLVKLKTKSTGDTDYSGHNYSTATNIMGSRVLGGNIFNTEADLTHPLLYGYHLTNIPVFRRGNTFYEPTKNIFASPLKYSKEPLLSGYLPSGLGVLASETPAVTVHGVGSGRVIAINDNLNLRGFWWGGSKIFANALFFGKTINRRTME